MAYKLKVYCPKFFRYCKLMSCLDNKKNVFPNWFLQYMYYEYNQGEECCSDYMISFHYVFDEEMLGLYDTVYHIRAFPTSEDIIMSRSEKTSKEELFEFARNLSRSLNVPFSRMKIESEALILNSPIKYEDE